MDEEEAVFVVGKALSELRNSGEDLSTERIRVGSSWVLPEELADEYEKHFPPGPRRAKQITDKVFTYEMVDVWECRGQAVGLKIQHLDRSFDVLESAEIFRCSNSNYQSQISTSPCDRFDIIKGDRNRFIIDKLQETISISYAVFRVDGTTFCEEMPIAGQGIHGIDHARTYFPFVPFDRFWKVWNGYVEFRKRQIAELRNLA
jgi:hypothetical protein